MAVLDSLVGGVVAVAVGVVWIVGVGAAHAQECDPAKLLSFDGEENDRFGQSVSLSGDTVVIGAPNWGFDGIDIGSAYVFTRVGGNWLHQTTLFAFDAERSENFGGAVSLSDDTVVIGLTNDLNNGTLSGSAYVLTRIGDEWSTQAKLVPGDWSTGAFGISVSVDGDTVIIGAWTDADNGSRSGSAYVFTRSGVVWTQQAKLLADDGGVDDRFGGSVCLSGDTAIVGAWTDTDNGNASGSAYAFTRSGGVWTQQAKLLPGDGEAGVRFGGSVSLSGDTAVIGARHNDNDGTGSGSAYVFARNGGVWTEQAKLKPGDGSVNDRFGHSVSLSGDTVVIGAERDDSAYVFTRSGGVWAEQAKLRPGDGSTGSFGWDASIEGETAVIGALSEERDGAAYVFDLNCTDCPADLNGDGVVNTQDFLAFLGAWSAGDPLADWNGDGDINTLDFLAYLADWSAGCP